MSEPRKRCVQVRAVPRLRGSVKTRFANFVLTLQDRVVPFSAKASEASGTHFLRLRIFYIYNVGTLIGHFDPYTSREAPARTRLTDFSPLTGLKSKNVMSIKVFGTGQFITLGCERIWFVKFTTFQNFRSVQSLSVFISCAHWSGANAETHVFASRLPQTRYCRSVFSKSIRSFRHTFFTFTYFLHLQRRDPHRPFRPIYVPRGSRGDTFDQFFTSYWPQIKKFHGDKSVWTRLIHHSRLSTYLICEVYDFPEFPIGSESKCLIYLCTLEWCKRRNTRFCLTLAPDKI